MQNKKQNTNDDIEKNKTFQLVPPSIPERKNQQHFLFSVKAVITTIPNLVSNQTNERTNEHLTFVGIFNLKIF